MGPFFNAVIGIDRDIDSGDLQHTNQVGLLKTGLLAVISDTVANTDISNLYDAIRFALFCHLHLNATSIACRNHDLLHENAKELQYIEDFQLAKSFLKEMLHSCGQNMREGMQMYYS